MFCEAPALQYFSKLSHENCPQNLLLGAAQRQDLRAWILYFLPYFKGGGSEPHCDGRGTLETCMRAMDLG